MNDMSEDYQSISIVPGEHPAFDMEPGQSVALVKDELLLYGRMDDDSWSDGPRIGARLTADTRCTRCEGPFLAGHYLIADLAPNMSGTARHSDCDDPTRAPADR